LAPRKGTLTDYISGITIKDTPEEVDAVQPFSRQLVEDYGYSKDQIQTRPQYRVKARPSDTRKEFPVDIAVFLDSSKKEDDAYIIVECKKHDRKDGLSQLQDYLRFSRASLGVWYNGRERLFLRKIEKDGKILFQNIPNIPKNGQRIEDIGRFKRKDLVPTHNLKATFKAIRNHLAANTIGVTRDEVLAQQIINLIFCKIYDERFTEQDEMVTFRAGIDEESKIVKQRVIDLFNKVKRKYKEVIDDTDAISLDDNSVTYVIGELQNYCLIEAKRDVIADAFEVFIGRALKGGQGQFFTPRNVVKMMVDIIDPTDEDLIIDPACGSGGFLVESLRHIWRKLDAEGAKYHWNKENLKEEKMEVALNKIRGIDKDYFLSKVAKAYMAIIGDGKSGIFCEDSLENPSNWHAKTRLKVDLGKFSVLLTNPPFGAKIPVRGEEKLKQFDFGYKWKYDKKSGKWIKTQKLKEREEPQVLFIERCLSFLREGGRMAMVLPSGILGNERETYLREYIRDQGHLFAIVTLPFETFSPNVTINTSVLFIQKGGKTTSPDIFISMNKYCGHDKKGRAVDKDDIQNVSNMYQNNLSNKYNFSIKQSQLDTNFVAKRYLQKYINNLSLIKGGKFKTSPLSDIITGLHNGANIDDASIYVKQNEGIPYILVKSITKEGINFQNLKYIRNDLLTNRDVAKNIVSENNIVMTRAGNSGISSNIPSDLVNGIASGFLVNIHVDTNIVNQYYLVAFLNSEYGQLQLERISSGSILQSIRSSDLKNVEVILPRREIQDAIGNTVLQSINAQVENRAKIADAQRGISGLV
jgi:type I restriction enzyme M protein